MVDRMDGSVPGLSQVFMNAGIAGGLPARKVEKASGASPIHGIGSHSGFSETEDEDWARIVN